MLELLELLKDDPARYVQRSVANNLNDITKDHPDIVIEVCRRWAVDASSGRQWIVGHALRSLVKRGHRGALETLGVGAAPSVAIEDAKVTRRVKLGGEARFSFEIASTGRRSQDLLVDFSVHFVKASGESRAKVFKLRRMELEPGARASFAGRVSLAAMTTRTPHPGLHRIEVHVNGRAFPLGEFEVTR